MHLNPTPFPPAWVNHEYLGGSIHHYCNISDQHAQALGVEFLPPARSRQSTIHRGITARRLKGGGLNVQIVMAPTPRVLPPPTASSTFSLQVEKDIAIITFRGVVATADLGRAHNELGGQLAGIPIRGFVARMDACALFVDEFGMAASLDAAHLSKSHLPGIIVVSEPAVTMMRRHTYYAAMLGIRRSVATGFCEAMSWARSLQAPVTRAIAAVLCNADSALEFIEITAPGFA